MKGRIFSIEEFSVYDGPGIRTTVFFKGCPLKCNWCHSPEGKDFKKTLVKSPNGCLKCNKCIDVCPNHGENCVQCGKCSEVCPRQLIRISGDDYTVDELVDMLSKNISILNLNDGGFTFSGGEPLAQGEFLYEVLSKLKGKTNLALQTSGYCQKELFKKILSKLDLVLFDMKIMDHDLALKYEGIDNTIILNNLKVLKDSNVPFIARVPLIPTVVDTKENITEIIELLKDSKNLLRVELLPYNKFAGSKYKMINKEYKPMFDETIPSNPHLELFEQYGIKSRIL